MTPPRGLYVALVGLVVVAFSMGALCLADASGHPKPSVERSLLGLSSVSGLVIMVVGLIVHGHFLGRVFAIIAGAFLAFGVGSAFGFLVTKSSEEIPAAFGFLAAIGWLILAGIRWGKIRNVG